MSDTLYTIELAAPVGPTFTVIDSGGEDWFTFNGQYLTQTSVTLMFYTVNGMATIAAATYWSDSGNQSGTLHVEGIIENVRGTNGRDSITGNQVDNILLGDQSADGSGGNDILRGNAGNDTIYGGAGDDSISGEDDDDTLFGGSGDDTISGGNGIDLIEGGAGSDKMTGYDAGDTVSYASSSAGVRIEISEFEETYGEWGDAEGDSLSGFTDVIGSAHDDIILDVVEGVPGGFYNANAFSGGDGDDELWMGAGNDNASGGNGDDILVGQLGADTLTGGNGRDSFIFRKASESTLAVSGRDSIADFAVAEGDLIDLEFIDANVRKGGEQDFRFIGERGFTRKAGELCLKQTDDGYLVLGDRNGDREADFAISVETADRISAADFDL